jgi:hypothetical protein
MAPHCARNPKTATIVRVAEKAIQLNRLQGKPWWNRSFIAALSKIESAHY